MIGNPSNKKMINAFAQGFMNKARAAKTKVDNIPFHNKIGIGMSATGLGMSATGLSLSMNKTHGDIRREKVNERSLEALNKIHSALERQNHHLESISPNKN